MSRILKTLALMCFFGTQVAWMPPLRLDPEIEAALKRTERPYASWHARQEIPELPAEEPAPAEESKEEVRELTSCTPNGQFKALKGTISLKVICIRSWIGPNAPNAVSLWHGDPITVKANKDGRYMLPAFTGSWLTRNGKAFVLSALLKSGNRTTETLPAPDKEGWHSFEDVINRMAEDCD